MRSLYVGASGLWLLMATIAFNGTFGTVTSTLPAGQVQLALKFPPNITGSI